jgi:hypothetical protein
MLLQFAVENYLSFRDRTVLSMLADPRMQHGPGQVLEGPGGKQVLRAAAVYGANGSGKSNLIKALEAFQDMVLKGTRGDDALPVVPFKLDPACKERPAHFEVEIFAAGVHYSYGFEALAARVDTEWLHEVSATGEERMLFERERGTILVGDALTVEPKRKAFLQFVAEGTRANQLFLAEAGERNVVELEGVRKAIGGWWLVRPDAPYMPIFDELQEGQGLKETLEAVLKRAGTGIDEIRLRREEFTTAGLPRAEVESLLRAAASPEAKAHVHGIKTKKSDDGYNFDVLRLYGVHRLPDGTAVELRMSEESDGTRRLLNLAPILHHARTQDALFAVDELERSLHPLLTRLLLQQLFAQSDSSAQLIFTTHDSNLLDHRLLPRDSVWLMEKDPRGGSVLYPLSDLDQAQIDEVEKQGQGLEKGYLQGRFGAIPFFGSLSSRPATRGRAATTSAA